MEYQLKELSGVIFKNNYKKEDKQPDFKGDCLVNGEEMTIALWKREKNGHEYFSFSFSKKLSKKGATIEHEEQRQQQTEKQPTYNNDLPF